MAKSRAQQERHSRQMADAGRREAEHKTVGGRASLNLPKGVPLFAPKKEGPYELDHVPYEKGAKAKKFHKDIEYADPGQWYWERTYFVHRDIGPNKDSVVCLARTFGKPCPVCEYRAEQYKSPHHNEEELKELAPRERQLFLVVDRDDERKGVQLWDNSFHLYGKQLDEKIKNASPKRKEEYRRHWHADSGCTIRAVAKEKTMGRGKPFLEFSVDEINPRDPLPDEMLDHGYCLDDVVAEMTYDGLKKLFLEAAVADDPAKDDENEPPRRGRSRTDADDDPPTRSRRREPEPEEEPEEDAEPADIKVNDEVEFTYKGKKLVGDVISINRRKGIAEVDCGDTPYNVVKLSELTVTDDDNPGEPEEDEPPARNGRAGASAKRRPKPDEEDDEDAEEGDEDERPARRGRGRTRGRDDKDEDDDAFAAEDEGDEDEEVDEPPPRRGTRPAPKKPAGRERR